MSAIDPNIAFTGLSVAGLVLTLTAIHKIEQRAKSVVLESDDYREKTRKIAEEAAKGKATKEEVEALRVRLRAQEGKTGEDLTETKTFRREVIQ